MNLKTFIQSQFMRRIASKARLDKVRAKARVARIKTGGRPTLHYFHHAADPYSYLAVQALPKILQRYDVDLVCHLTNGKTGDYQGEGNMYFDWARRDAADVAPGYGLEAPTLDAPAETRVKQAEQALAALGTGVEFLEPAAKIGRVLWYGEDFDQFTQVDANKAAAQVAAGSKLQDSEGHYNGAMIKYEGEWFWGVDRLYVLEARLVEEGLSRDAAAPLCVPRPELPMTTDRDTSQIVVEVYPSLRSPYTAISFDRTVEMVEALGAKLVLKPVMPMMMRGIPAPAKKGMYILFDTSREARAINVPFGGIVDPFGDPVKTGFSLYPYAKQEGKGKEYLSAYLKCAFADKVDITTDKGLAEVCRRAGLDWSQAKAFKDKPGYMDELEANVADMLNFGLWGVPSFRVVGGNDEQAWTTWGQDRLWRVGQEVLRRAQ
ncbi:MAG: DsbA family protein [Alphaproteobacteria bacterium]